MSPSSPDRVNAILACLRQETTHEAVAEMFGVSLDEVKQWETEFVAGGAAALNGSTGPSNHADAAHDQLTQMGALNAISQSLSGILTVDDLLNTTLETLRTVFGYIPMVCLVENDDLVIKGGYALDGKKINWYNWRLPTSTEHSILAWVAAHGKPLNLPDVSRDARYVYQEVVGHVASELATPIMFKGNVLGVLDVKSEKYQAFGQNDMSILETVASQLAVAIENASLFETVRHRVAQLELVQSVTAYAIKNFDMQGILKYTVEVTQAIMGYSGVAIGLLSEDRATLELTTIFQSPEKTIVSGAMKFPIDDATVIGSAAHSGQIIVANEVRRDVRFALNPLFETSQAELVVPMYSKDVLFGVINVESEQPGAFHDADVTSLTLLANQLTIALVGAGLFQQTQDQIREISRLLDEVQQTNARFYATMEATDEGIIVWDENWRVLFANSTASQLLGTPVAALVGCNRGDSETPPQLLRVSEAQPDERIELAGDERRICTSRNLRWHSDSASGYMTVITDITHQVALEEERQEMTSMLVHDLRGPLTSVVGGIELAQMGIAEGEAQDKIFNFLGMAHRSGDLLLSMTNSLLDIATLEYENASLEHLPLQISAIFEDVIGIHSNTARSANIEISVTRDEDLPIIEGDNSMIRRALSNLLDNALKFTPDGGEVSISAMQDGDMIRFKVADSGPGVPEPFRQRIFEKYVQVPGRKGRRRGTGLGLAFVKLVAKAHHGRLWVEPRPGGGSIFVLTVGNSD